jgi:hypothetical protein
MITRGLPDQTLYLHATELAGAVAACVDGAATESRQGPGHLNKIRSLEGLVCDYEDTPDPAGAPDSRRA